MGKIKDEIQNLIEICERKYEEGGSAAVIDYIEEAFRQGEDLIILNVKYERCDACDANMPSITNICLVCGQPTKPQLDKQQLVDAVIEDLKKGFALGDYTVLDELLNKLQIKTLVQSLPEEEWDKYKELNNSYFEIMHQDFFEDAGREEIQIHAGENGNVMIVKTPEGFVVDVYGQNDLVDTLAIWEDSLNDVDDEDESFDPNNFSMVEKEDFIDEWGQYTDEVTAELGYPEEGSDDLLMVDYFYHEESRKWIPKCCSQYTPREQAIADYLRLG